MGVDGQFDRKLTIESVRLIKNSKKKKKENPQSHRPILWIEATPMCKMSMINIS